jgi:bacillopeptidase F
MLTLGGILGMLLFLALFGVKLLVGFSLFVDKLRGSTPNQQQTQIILLPPQLDPLPYATYSGEIRVSGKAKGDVTILLYVNEKQTERTKPKEDGIFTFLNVKMKNGVNVISAKATDDKDNASDLSEVLTIQVKTNKPTLDITTPSENEEITGEKQITTVTGKTESDNSVTINDRFVVIKSDGSFSYDLSLKEGEQTITIVAKDQAGNETKMERKVTYKK